MSEPTTPRGRKIYSLSCAIQEHAEAAAIAYERGDILARSYHERHADDARDELSGLVDEMEKEMARCALDRDAWRHAADTGASIWSADGNEEAMDDWAQTVGEMCDATPKVKS